MLLRVEMNYFSFSTKSTLNNKVITCCNAIFQDINEQGKSNIKFDAYSYIDQMSPKVYI